jgi:hypothetical protein
VCHGVVLTASAFPRSFPERGQAYQAAEVPPCAQGVAINRGCPILVLPYTASLVAKHKGDQLYYFVESARVDGQPRIVHQAYLGTAEKVAAGTGGRWRNDF